MKACQVANRRVLMRALLEEGASVNMTDMVSNEVEVCVSICVY